MIRLRDLLSDHQFPGLKKAQQSFGKRKGSWAKPQKGDKIRYSAGGLTYWGNITGTSAGGRVVHVKYPTQHHTSSANLNGKQLEFVSAIYDSGYSIFVEKKPAKNNPWMK